MSKIKAKFNEIKGLICKIKFIQVADLLTLGAFFIVFFTTFLINKYIGMYVLAVILVIISYFLSKNAHGGDG
ncbi:hypothetical protein [Clostridium tyrobutyricum]|uniref:hypothetical protein n=1 Tax=Clostridium tyrobutyricum TaxID=1519 RepID=UPI001C381836|nr:hypothetical protein [Clostridium tyrobutyricum]MBV4417462.1 hypothetical protein [Clostridium tyrobutyricum]